MKFQSTKKALTLLLIMCSLGSSTLGAVEEANLVSTQEYNYPETTVTITNALDDKSALAVHCKSKDDDLGPQLVLAGETYDFTFRVRVVGGTLFFCAFGSNYGTVEFATYREDRDWDDDRCATLCKWVVTSVGVLGFRQTNPPRIDLSFPWVK